MMKIAISKNRKCAQTIPNLEPKWSKSLPYFRPKLLKNHTLGGQEYPPQSPPSPLPTPTLNAAFIRGFIKLQPKILL